MAEELYGVFIVPLIMGVVAMSIATGLPRKYGGVASLVLGLVIGLLYGITEGGWTVLQSIIVGSALGLSASGFYSTQKNVLQKPEPVAKNDEPGQKVYKI